MKKASSYIIITLLTGLIGMGCDNSKKGCTDPNSSSYDPQAETNNGSCSYPSETKKAVCFFFTDSDNSTCGTFGIDLLDQVKATNPANTYFISVHPNGTDSLFCPQGIDVASSFSVSGFPDFGVGEQASLLTQTDITTAIQSEVGETALANMDISSVVQGDSLIVTMYGRFFTSDTSKFFAAAYLVEDNVTSFQAGKGSYSHQHVLRASTGSSGVGTQVNELPISFDESFKVRQGIYIQSNWNMSNTNIVGVIWKKNGADFEFINANM